MASARRRGAVSARRWLRPGGAGRACAAVVADAVGDQLAHETCPSGAGRVVKGLVPVELVIDRQRSAVDGDLGGGGPVQQGLQRSGRRGRGRRRSAGPGCRRWWSGVGCVRRADRPSALRRRRGRRGRPRAGGWPAASRRLARGRWRGCVTWSRRGPDLDQLAGTDLAGRAPSRGCRRRRPGSPCRPAADAARRPRYGPGRQRPQGGVVAGRPHADDLAVGAVGLSPPRAAPTAANAASISSMRREARAGQDMVADDLDLPLDPALAGGPVGGQDVDVEVVVAGERDRLRVQRHRLARGDVPADDRLGPVVDDRRRAPRRSGRTPAGGSPRTSARSWLVVKQQNGSREYDSTMWNE